VHQFYEKNEIYVWIELNLIISFPTMKMMKTNTLVKKSNCCTCCCMKQSPIPV